MDKKQFIAAIVALKELPQKKFKQTYEFILNLKELDLKKPEEQIELWVQLPFDKGKPIKIAALVGPELAEAAKAACDTVILHDNFSLYAADKKMVKKIASQHYYFIAQANIMPDVAKTFGRVLGPRGKMPNPKAGCVVAPNANLKALTDKLRKTIKVAAKVQPSIKVPIGTQHMADEQVADNMLAVYSAVRQKLPQEAANIKSVLLKLTMSSPVKITPEGIVKPAVKATASATSTSVAASKTTPDLNTPTPEKKMTTPKKSKKTEGAA